MATTRVNWNYEDDYKVTKFIIDEYCIRSPKDSLSEAVDLLYIRLKCRIPKTSIKAKIQNTKTLLSENGIKNLLPCQELANYSDQHRRAFLEIMSLYELI